MHMRSFNVVQSGQPLQLMEQEAPKPTGTEVLLRVKAAGLCHSDLHLWEGHYDLGDGKKLSFTERGVKLPLTLSHEICGEVVVAGPDAGAVRIGMNAIVHPWIGCHECPTCRSGQENLCNRPQTLGIIRPGGFSDYVLVPHPRYLVDLGELDPVHAAPLACAGETTYSALKKFGERIYHTPVVIIGAGGLGLMAIEMLKGLGAKGAISVDISAEKREAAMQAGALHAIDSSAPDAAKQIIEATQGGAHAVLDLVGCNPTMSLAMDASARGGHIILIGLMGGNITIPLPTWPTRSLKIEGSYVGNLPDLKELVELLREGKIKPPKITSRPLAEVNDSIQDLLHGKVTGRMVLQP